MEVTTSSDGEGPREPGGGVVLEFQPKLEDHLAATRLYYRTTSGPGIDRAAAMCLLLVGVVATATSGFGWWTVASSVLAAAEWFDLLSVERLRARLQFRRDPRYGERYRLVLSDEGIHFTTGTLDSKLSCSFYDRAIEGADHFLLVYGRWAFSTLPKRLVGRTTDVAVMRELIARHLRLMDRR